MLFITDKRLDKMTALKGLDPEQKTAALGDAEAVYRYVRRSEGQLKGAVPEDGVRKWGEQHELGPDRLNTALAVLLETNRLVAVDAQVTVPDGA